MSIRLRLTVLYTVILCVTLVVFSVFVYALLTHNLVLQMDHELNDAANAGARIPRILSAAGGSSDAERQALGRVLAQRNGALPPGAGGPPPGPDLLLQYVDPAGAIVRSGGLIDSDLTLPVPSSPPTRRGFETVNIAGDDYRILNDPVPAARGGGVLQVATRMTEVQETQAHLQAVLGFGIAGAVILAGAVGWALATVALRPIDRMTQAAHEIGEAQDFSRRVPYRGPTDEVGRLAGTFNEMLGRLQASYARIQRALDAQRRFVADASHELRTPLTTIRGNVELLELEEGDESPDRREALRDIASEAERMSRLVTDLLVLARADAGLHIQRSPTRIQPIVEAVCRQVARTSGDVHIDAGPMPDVTVLGSEDHLKQLLLILLDNARKYSPSGGTVHVLGEAREGWLSLSVSDQGPGVPIEDQERIFDRFYRLDPSRHGEGAGLGLAIARWIATEHDGRLTLASRPGEGSTFTVSLPFLDSTPATPETPQPIPARA